MIQKFNLTLRLHARLLVAAILVCANVACTSKDKESAAPETPGTAAKPTVDFALQALYGFKSTDGKIKIGTEKIVSVWFGRDFEDAQGGNFVVFTKEQALEDGEISSCHTCSVNISAITYRQIHGNWQQISTTHQFTQIGAYGDAPKVSAGDVVRMNPKVSGFFLDDSYSGQGYTNNYKNIFAFDGKQWRSLGAIEVSADNKGTDCVDQTKETPTEETPACWSFAGDVTIHGTDDSSYPDITVARRGTYEAPVNFKAVQAEPVTFRFNGQQYADVKAPTAPVPTQQSQKPIDAVRQQTVMDWQKDEMFKTAITGSRICMRDGVRSMLLTGQRDRDGIAKWVQNVCGPQLTQVLTMIGRPQNEATAFVKALAYQEINLYSELKP